MNALILESEPSMPRRSTSDPDPEVPAKARRRRFSASYKLRILEEAEQCREPGEIGALLRREGLYSSLVSRWRQQREAGAQQALTPKKRGRKAHPVDPQARRVAELERENARLREKLEKAQTIIEVQKKLSQLLGNDPEGES
jgi:transposase